MPAATRGRTSEWAEGEDANERDREELAEEPGQEMRVRGYDPAPIREVMGG